MKFHTSPSLFLIACWQQINYMIYDLLNRVKLVIHKKFWIVLSIRALLRALFRQIEVHLFFRVLNGFLVRNLTGNIVAHISHKDGPGIAKVGVSDLLGIIH